MKLSEYIKGLKNFLKQHGDLQAYYASDDEGNLFNKVSYSGTKMFTFNDHSYILDDVFNDDPDELDELDEEDRKQLKPVCIVN